MKKKLAILLTVLLVGVLAAEGLATDKVYAKTAQMYLDIPDTIKKENEFHVKVVLDSEVELYSIDAYLSYDAQKLEFVPENELVTGADGVLELKDLYGQETKNVSYDITFKALDTGTAQISLDDVFLIDYADLDYIEVASSVKQFEIGINQTVDSDAGLADLIVAPGELTGSFQAYKREYEMHVGADVERIGVTAVPAEEDSVVDLDMPDTLQIGENLVRITVTALSGNEITYTIHVYREAVDMTESESQTVETEEAFSNQTVETETSSSALEQSTETAVTELPLDIEQENSDIQIQSEE